ncbi:DUF4169 family protein [Terrihabitans sp. B22-R8]|uniref:DUF4169 family protein n=1 Tax=Terrihabitans sp. B22-R8 TaxID=3425128 RepID=UPI00403CD4A3
MADLINLNKARKQRARAEKNVKAAANRVVFGRTKSDKDAEKARAENAARLLDGHRREPDPS